MRVSEEEYRELAVLAKGKQLCMSDLMREIISFYKKKQPFLKGSNKYLKNLDSVDFLWHKVGNVIKRLTMNAIDALKFAYRKHHLGDELIGWDELSDCLLDALCNELGDDGFQEWLASNKPVEPITDYCRSCGLDSTSEICPHCGYPSLNRGGSL